MILAFAWAAWSAVVSAVAALAAAGLAWWALRDNRKVLATNEVMARANRELVDIEASRRAEEIAAREAEALSRNRANISIEIIGAGSKALRSYQLVVRNAGPANAYELTVSPVAFTGYQTPDFALPGIKNGVHPVSLHAREPMALELDAVFMKGALPGLECVVRWRDADGDTPHEMRMRATVLDVSAPAQFTVAGAPTVRRRARPGG